MHGQFRDPRSFPPQLTSARHEGSNEKEGFHDKSDVGVEDPATVLGPENVQPRYLAASDAG